MLISPTHQIDARLGNVCKTLVDRISEKQSISFRRISRNYNEQVQFSRFINNSRVPRKALEETCYQQFLGSCPSDRHVLLIEDTTKVSFSLARKIKGLGSIDKGQVQGFYLHPLLCLDAVDGARYGVCHLELYQRPFEEKEELTRRQKQLLRNKVAFEDKESYRWYNSVCQALPKLSTGVTKTVVADRESDIYAVLTGLTKLGVNYVIRGRHDWVVLGEAKKLSEAMAGWETFSRELDLPATDGRTAHRAELNISFGQVTLKKGDSKAAPAYSPATHTTWVVHVKEAAHTVVGKEKPVEWILYTLHPVEDIAAALQVIGWYKERWNIEQVFRILKSKGVDIMSSQLDSAEKLHKLTILALMACVQVLELVRARAGTTQQQAQPLFTPEQAVFIEQLNPALEGRTAKLKNPHPKVSLAFAAWVIARLAGWSGYQKQRPPGPIDFLQGLVVFYQQYKGFCLARDVYIL